MFKKIQLNNQKWFLFFRWYQFISLCLTEIFAAISEMVLRVIYKNRKIIGWRCLLLTLVGQQLRIAVVDEKGGCRVAKRYPNKNGVFISEYPMYHAIFTYTPHLLSSLYIYSSLHDPLWFRTAVGDAEQCI